MPSSGFTPGNGGGSKPAKPQPETAPDFPWLVPQPRPEPEPEVISVTPMVNIVSSNPPPPAQQTSVKPRPATTHPGPILVTPDILDIKPDAVGSLEQQIAALYDGQSVGGSAQPIEQAPAQVASGYESTPLTPGQAHVVDHLLTVETDSLAREVLITIKRDGMPPRSQWNDFMAQFALWNWDETSDAQARATLALIVQSDWDDLFAQAESSSNAVKAFTLEDVRQFIEIDLTTETFDDADVAHYEEMLNKVFDRSGKHQVFKKSIGKASYCGYRCLYSCRPFQA